MRLLYFIYTLESGGAERQLKYLLNGHSNHIEPAVCYIDPSGSNQLNDNVTQFHVPRNHPLDFRWRPITKLLKSWQPDIVINWLPYVVIHTLIPTRLAKIPTYISVFRNTHSLKSPRELPRFVNHWQADGIASNTHADEQSLMFRNLCEKKPFKWVPNGFDIQQITDAEPADLAQFGFRPDIPTLLFVGRLTTIKNPLLLIDVVRRLKRDGIETQLLICGKGELETELKTALSNADLDKHIHLAGYRHDIFNLMKASTLLVHPSWQEGLPNVLIEGMAAGLPIIASSIPVHKRWIINGENGLMAAPDDCEKFTQHVQRVLSDSSLRARLIADGQKTAVQLTIPKMVRSYEDWYETFLNK